MLGKSCVKVKPLTCLDYTSVKDIYRSEFCSKGYNFSTLHDAWRYKDSDSSFGAFSKDGDLLGFILIQGNYITRLAVHPNFQGLRIGATLLMKVLSQCYHKKKTLYLTPLNVEEPLLRFYHRHGFHFTPKWDMVFHFHNTRRQRLYIGMYAPAN